MTPNHHIDQELLVAYTTGHLGQAVAVLVATHLALCPVCRSLADEAEAVGGAMFEGEASEGVGSGVLDALLSRLDDDDREIAPSPSPSAKPAVIPDPLRSFTGPFDQIPWAWRAPGIQTVELDLKHGDLPVRLFRLAGGFVVPAHGHDGHERGLVLTGGFTDDLGHFVRGDVSLRGPQLRHEARVDKGEPCVVLFVNDNLLVPRTLAGRVAAPFIKI